MCDACLWNNYLENILHNILYHFACIRNIPRTDKGNASYISRVHDTLLRRALRGEKYLKLYSYHYLINGFAVLVTPEQVCIQGSWILLPLSFNDFSVIYA